MPPAPNNPTSGTAARSVKQVADTFGGIVTGLQTIASMGGQPAAAIGAVGSQIGKVASLMGPWGVAIGSVVGVVSQLPQLFKSAGDSISNYVKAFSPLTADRYGRAWADLTASIGEYLVPVLELATGVVRYFGDMVAGLKPVVQPVVDLLAEIYGNAYGAAGDVFEEFMELAVTLGQVVMPILLDGIKVLYSPVIWLTNMLKDMARAVDLAAKSISAFLGIQAVEFDGQSFGKSAASTHTTNTESVLKTLRERAFAVGTGQPKKDMAAETVGILTQLWSWIQNELPKLIAGVAAGIGAKLGEFVKSLPPAIAAAILKTVEKIREMLNLGGAGLGAAGNIVRDQMRQVIPVGVPGFAGL